jgi:hypothetical protein
VGKLIAKLKFWFGDEIIDLFNTKDYDIEITENGYVYIRTRGND